MWLSDMIKYAIRFMRNGVSIFREAAKGSYTMSPRVRQYVQELAQPSSGPMIDKENLMSDRRSIARDVNIAFEKLK